MSNIKTVIDLFSGAGGLTEGFGNNNFKIIGHVEKDFAASQTLALRESYRYLKKYGDFSKYICYLKGDISLEQLFNLIPKEIKNAILNIEINDSTLIELFEYFDTQAKIANIDGIIGGPPCQAYSTIGRAVNARKKNTDERIYLYKYYIQFLERYNPKFFIFENVKGLLSFKDIDGELLFPKMRYEFEEAGYTLSYRIINAADYGIPQKRERVIIFGVQNSNSNLINSFFTNLELLREKTMTVGDAFIDLPFLKSGTENNSYRKKGKSKLLDYYRGNKNIPLTQNIARYNNDNDLEIYKIVSEAKQQGYNIKYDELDKRLRTHKHVDKFLDRYKALSWEYPAHTIVAHIAKDGHHYIHPDIYQNRSITVREAARLQGFPDDYYFLNSRTSAFTQIGNAVPPILSSKMAEVISGLDFK